jgi:predicted RNase H-like nuclease (RuvC/YqgF family)
MVSFMKGFSFFGGTTEPVSPERGRERSSSGGGGAVRPGPQPAAVQLESHIATGSPTVQAAFADLQSTVAAAHASNAALQRQVEELQRCNADLTRQLAACQLGPGIEEVLNERELAAANARIQGLRAELGQLQEQLAAEKRARESAQAAEAAATGG